MLLPLFAFSIFPDHYCEHAGGIWELCNVGKICLYNWYSTCFTHVLQVNKDMKGFLIKYSYSLRFSQTIYGNFDFISKRILNIF